MIASHYSAAAAKSENLIGHPTKPTLQSSHKIRMCLMSTTPPAGQDSNRIKIASAKRWAHLEGVLPKMAIFEFNLVEYFSCEKIAGCQLGKASKGQIRHVHALSDAFLAERRPPSML